MKKYRKLLFDVDNTLLDFDEAERNGIRKVLEAYGEIPDEGKLALYSSINASVSRRAAAATSSAVTARMAAMRSSIVSERPRIACPR